MILTTLATVMNLLMPRVL